MEPQTSSLHDDFDDPPIAFGEVEETSDDGLWFLPGPIEEEPDDLPPGPRAEPRETGIVDDWRKAEADNAARLGLLSGSILAAGAVMMDATNTCPAAFGKLGDKIAA